jgi:hypothetical protein
MLPNGLENRPGLTVFFAPIVSCTDWRAEPVPARGKP